MVGPTQFNFIGNIPTKAETARLERSYVPSLADLKRVTLIFQTRHSTFSVTCTILWGRSCAKARALPGLLCPGLGFLCCLPSSTARPLPLAAIGAGLNCNEKGAWAQAIFFHSYLVQQAQGCRGSEPPSPKHWIGAPALGGGGEGEGETAAVLRRRLTCVPREPGSSRSRSRSPPPGSPEPSASSTQHSASRSSRRLSAVGRASGIYRAA
ncbi:hypothetical protein KIL84_003338 [Mauremys mutica]|uniref:Uncharacterized protein n=1 Tax=Mauremys mutica TaxID=74926 RepID=A0A9D3WVP1_9SAUR|nr:hypothetical protein KIL84_003338 [Mauremys mutica]